MDPAPNPAVKGKWFKDRMADAGLTQRQAAKLMGMDHAVLSKRINGIYQWSAREISEWAAIVRVPLEDAMRHAAIKLHETRHVVPVVGTIDELGLVGAGNGGKKVERPSGLTAAGDIEALLVKAPGKPADGWVLYYDPKAKGKAEAVGRVSVVQLHGRKAKRYVRVLARGFGGTWTLRSLTGLEPIEGVEVEWASPVLWIRT